MVKAGDIGKGARDYVKKDFSAVVKSKSAREAVGKTPPPSSLVKMSKEIIKLKWPR